MFGRKKDPKEALRAMISTVRRQEYKIERQEATMIKENQKLEQQIKQAAKAKDLDSAKKLAKQLVHGRKVVSHLRTSAAQAKCLKLELNRQISQSTLMAAVGSSTNVLKSVQELVKLPLIHDTMKELSKEMMKMGIINEMVEDSMDSVFETEELDDEVQAEVDKVLSELAIDTTTRLPTTTPGTIVPTPEPAGAEPTWAEGSVEQEEEEEGGIAEMQARLAALRN